jgi:tRNA(Ile)-lysidine synthase
MIVWEKFKKLVEREGLVKPGDGVLAAVSGGPDSVCLLHLLWRLKKTVPFKLDAVTINHGLRKEAAKEVGRVAALCEKLGVPLFVRSIGVREFAGRNKTSIETAARALRYGVFSKTASAAGSAAVATGHTANDNAETIMMWLIRGTGAEGVSGIPVSRRLEGGVRVIRPMLSATRAEVMEYIRRNKLQYSIDRSNLSKEYTRNRIRAQVLPMLEKYNPRVVEHLFNFSQIMNRENDFMNDAARKAIRLCAAVGNSKITLDYKRFLKYNKAIQLRIIKYIMPEKRSAAQVEFLREWFLFSSGRKLKFSRDWSVKRLKNKIIFKKIR